MKSLINSNLPLAMLDDVYFYLIIDEAKSTGYPDGDTRTLRGKLMEGF